MDNSIIEKSPAKINLFLKILNRREDNYHNIRTGITSINLCDEIEVKPSNQFNVEYKGAFAPENNKFDDCIIKKIFSFLNISPPNISFSITTEVCVVPSMGVSFTCMFWYLLTMLL